MSITRSLRRAALCRRGPSLRRWVSSPGQAPEPQEPAAAPAEEVVWYALWRSEKGKRMLRWACMLYVAVLAAAWYMSAAYEAAVQVLKDEKKAQPDPTAALRLGGHMQLTDHNGAPFNTEEQLRGKWWLVYFGFANCATVCPAELTKITDALNELDADPSLPQVTPLFVTLDPDRDTPQAVKKFVEPYHKRFVGLTGSTEEIKEAAKKFRVYFSVIDTEDQALQPGETPEDYQLDHSCIIYLMSPNGKFCEFFSKETEGNVATEKVRRHLDGTMAYVHEGS